MTELDVRRIRPRMNPMTAVQFTGSSLNAMAILDWAQEGGALARGHYRQGIGQEPDCVFIPLASGAVIRVDHWSWLVRAGPGQFTVFGIEEFADRLEVEQ